MAELTAEAALKHAITKRLGSENGALLLGCLHSSRTARLLFNAGAAEGWATQDESRPQLSTQSRLAKFAASEIAHLLNRQRGVEDEVLNHRRAACSRCPNKTAAPDDRLYHLGKRIIRPDGDDICSLCGCFIAEKTKRQSETCPDTDPIQTTHSRWGDLLSAKIDHQGE
jgi:hypothetical protein